MTMFNKNVKQNVSNKANVMKHHWNNLCPEFHKHVGILRK